MRHSSSAVAAWALLLLVVFSGCSKGSNGSSSAPPADDGGTIGANGKKRIEAVLRNVPLTDALPAQRVGRGPNDSVWVSNSSQVSLIDVSTGATIRTIKLPFEVYQDRDLISNGRSMALLRSDSESSTELATVDTTTLGIKTFKLGATIGNSNTLSFTRDLTLVAVNTPTSVRFLARNPSAYAFDVFKAELKYPDNFIGAGTELSSGTLISRNSNWAVTPVRRKDLKEGGLFLMDLFTRKTSLIFRQPAPRKGMLVDAPSVYAFSDDSAYLVGQQNLQAGRLSIYDLKSASLKIEIDVQPKENSVIDSLSQPQIVGGRIFCNVTMFDPDASERSSQINIYDLVSGELVSELKLPDTINSYAVLSDHRVVGVAAERLFVFDL